MFQCTVRPERTETAIVMRARGPLGLGIDVEVEAVVAVGAREGAGIVRALGHAAQIVLVEELARLALLAQAAQPMLAHEARLIPSAAAFVGGST